MSQNGSAAAREPAFNAPWPPLLLAAGLVALYALQAISGDQDAVFYRYGLITSEPGQGWRTVTSLFVHGGWAHVVLNAVGLLAFGAGVSRLFGSRPFGALAFFVFYIACGALSGWGFMLLTRGSDAVLIGASGAVAGLMAAASRVVGRRPEGGGSLAPFTSPTVVSMAVAWIVINLMVALFGFAPGMGAVPVAWQAHLAGYAAGLLLIGPTAAGLRRLEGPRLPIDSRA